MSRYIDFEAREKREESDESDEDILENLKGEELNNSDEEWDEDDSNASDVDEFGNLKDFVVSDRKLNIKTIVYAEICLIVDSCFNRCIDHRFQRLLTRHIERRALVAGIAVWSQGDKVSFEEEEEQEEQEQEEKR